MTLNELRSAMEAILDAEQAADVDWDTSEKLCRATKARLRSQPAPDYTDDLVHVFLDDANLRRDDADYARIQHERLRNWLEGSEIIAR